MSSSSLSRSSISKQRGAEMSSRLIPPKVGAIRRTASTIRSASLRVEADREGVDRGELLEQHRLALHHRHRRLGADVAEPEHRRAVGDDRDRVALDREVEGLLAVLGDLHADPRDAGRVGHREVVARLQRVLVVLLDLAAAVHRERAVDVVDHPRAPGRPDRAQDLLPMLLVAGVDGELAHPLALAAGAGDEVDALQSAPGLRDRRGQLPERLLARVELDAHGDGELGGDAGHGRRFYARARGRPGAPWSRSASRSTFAGPGTGNAYLGEKPAADRPNTIEAWRRPTMPGPESSCS